LHQGRRHSSSHGSSAQAFSAFSAFCTAREHQRSSVARMRGPSARSTHSVRPRAAGRAHTTRARASRVRASARVLATFMASQHREYRLRHVTSAELHIPVARVGLRPVVSARGVIIRSFAGFGTLFKPRQRMFGSNTALRHEKHMMAARPAKVTRRATAPTLRVRAHAVVGFGSHADCSRASAITCRVNAACKRWHVDSPGLRHGLLLQVLSSRLGAEYLNTAAHIWRLVFARAGFGTVTEQTFRRRTTFQCN
jgi:hypothetical protein